MEKLSLDYLIKRPAIVSEKTYLLILLHGFGSNEEDLFSFTNELPDEFIIVSARAPQTLGLNSFAWYSIDFSIPTGNYSNINEAIAAREKITGFIDEIQQKYSITPQKTFLLGFSQGAILSYSIALNYPEKVQKVIALSGYILEPLLPNNSDKKDYSKLNFFCSHGTVDQVIPFEKATKTTKLLNQLKIQHTFKKYPVGHGVTPMNFFDFKNWIENQIT